MPTFYVALTALVASQQIKTWLIYYKSAPIMHSLQIQNRHPVTACLAEYQATTPYEAWESRRGPALECGVTIDPRDVVAVLGFSTGTKSVRGVPEFRMCYADAVPVFGPIIRRTQTGGWLLKGRSTRRYRTYALAVKAFVREKDRIAAVLNL